MSENLQTLEGKIEPIELEDEMRSSFIATRMRRWLGLRPSRTSGRARSVSTLIA